MPDLLLELAFEAEAIHWRGPSPYFFIPVPAPEAAELKAVSRAVSYGWGMVPAEAEIAGHAFATALFPKNGTYYLPLKDDVRDRTGVTAGHLVPLTLRVYANASLSPAQRRGRG
ncbi:DUF1905 domain-containing protein [Phenylobacterium sp. J367]|uniref:DUF1905 domain-containing protein n=1 Tax=Phenylobacterium sp. J367 TaxID=2898435 RepID=UPI002151AF2D|nr:DUF1905 domain-containing protein [Phenylobacterium sp. J367]MCR5879235.1 DUF1905 domain-containing protein [Phenylobacterium sp. J367]